MEDTNLSSLASSGHHRAHENENKLGGESNGSEFEGNQTPDEDSEFETKDPASESLLEQASRDSSEEYKTAKEIISNGLYVHRLSGALQHVRCTPSTCTSMKAKKTSGSFNVANVFLGILSPKFILQLCTLVMAMLLLLAGDVERNPGPVTLVHILNMDDHPDVCNYVKVMEIQQLKELGGILGLSYANVSKMNQLPSDMVAAWLRAEDNVEAKSGSPSWESLIKALREIRQTGIANKIDSEKVKIQVNLSESGDSADTQESRPKCAIVRRSGVSRTKGERFRRCYVVEWDDGEPLIDTYTDGGHAYHPPVIVNIDDIPTDVPSYHRESGQDKLSRLPDNSNLRLAVVGGLNDGDKMTTSLDRDMLRPRKRAQTRENRATTINLLPDVPPEYMFVEKYNIVSVSDPTLTPFPKQSSNSSDLSNDSGGSDSSPDDDDAVTLSSKPSIRELRQLPVTNLWYNLGLQLKVSQEELERIQSKYRDEKLCTTKMFGVWRREDDSPSYEKLLQALAAVGRRDLVESICKQKGPASASLLEQASISSEVCKTAKEDEQASVSSEVCKTAKEDDQASESSVWEYETAKEDDQASVSSEVCKIAKEDEQASVSSEVCKIAKEDEQASVSSEVCKIAKEDDQASESSEEYETAKEDDQASESSEGYETAKEDIESTNYKGSDSSSDDDGAVTLSSKPSIRELRQLPVTNLWYNLGLQLKVSQEELDKIQSKYRDEKLCRTKMFGVWRREDDSPSYEKLLQALAAVGRRDLVESICKQKGSSFDSFLPNSPHDQVIEQLLEEGDLPLLTSILGEYASKWNLIGTALGFTPQAISNIRSKPKLFETAPKSWLIELLNEWLNNCSPLKVESTVEELDTALKSQLVGLGAVAEKLKRQLRQRPPSPMNPKPNASPSPIHSPNIDKPNASPSPSPNHSPNIDKPNASPCPLPKCIKEYAEFLKSTYRRALPLTPPGEWPPNQGRQYSDVTIVERVRNSLPDPQTTEERSKAMNQGKVKVFENEREIKSLDDVLPQDSNASLKVLVEGIPGVGKSTLVRKSCKDWADGNSLQQFDLVLLVTLRKQNAKKIEELLEADNSNLKTEVANHLRKTSGEGVLFLFDGYDELNEEEQPLFQELIRGGKLHKCSLVLTSRSYAVEDLKYEECIHRHVEILGFTEQQMESYFHQNIVIQKKSEESTLVQSLKEEASLSSISYTPLNCSILLCIFEQENPKLPNTLTKLYGVFVLSLIKRHLKKFRTRTPKSLDSLPHPTNVQFSALCKLAYNGLEQGKFKFSAQDITDANQGQGSCKGDIEANLLSLMTSESTTSFRIDEEESHYQFLHATVQEFLAARWIGRQPLNEQKRFLSTKWRYPKLRSRLVFFAGITKFGNQLFDKILEDASHSSALFQYDNTDSEILPPNAASNSRLRSSSHLPTTHYLKQKSSAMERYGRSSANFPKILPMQNQGTDHEAFLNFVSMIHEAKNDSLYQNFQQKINKQVLDSFLGKHGPNLHGVNLRHCKLTGLECSAIASFLSKCPNCIKSIQFNFCSFTDKSVEIFHKVSKSGKKQSECVKCQFNYCAPSFPLALSLLPQISWFQETKVLHLHGLQYPKGLNPDKFHLFSLLNMSNLEELSVTVEQIPKEHLHDYETVFLKFVEALRTNNTLRHFSYNQSPLAATCESFVQLMSALSHNTKVSLLIENTDVITADSVIIPKGICFKVCSRGLAAAMELADAQRTVKRLQVNYNQRSVNLQCSCKFSVETSTRNTCCLSDFLLNTTYNSRSPPPEDLARLITIGLTLSNTLRSLDISRCQVTDEVAQCIAAGLAENRTLKEIKLNPSHLTSKGVGYILESVNPDKSVDKLDIQCKVKSHEFKVISRSSTSGMVATDCFSTVVLFNHRTSTESTSATIKKVVEALFDIENQMIQPMAKEMPKREMIQAKEMPRNSHWQALRTLDVSKCIFADDEVAACIAAGLAMNWHSLKMLNLSYNNITITGAVKIFKSLESNTSLEELDLSWNKLQSSIKISGESLGCVVEKILTVNQTLRRINLQYCELDNEVAAHIAMGLTKNHFLKILKLGQNNITSTGAMEIFKSLKSNTSLEELVLHETRFQSSTGKSFECHSVNIKEMLTDNQTLRRLDLSHCKLDDEVAAHIATGLTKNPSLKILKLGQNNITSTGAMEIFKSLESSLNSTLEALDLSRIKFLPRIVTVTKTGESLGSVVEKVLTVKQMLRSLELQNCRLNNEVAAHIATGLSKNHSLKTLNLRNNKITSTGAVEIFKSLYNTNTSLEEIDLAWNNLHISVKSKEGESLQCVTKLLIVNQTLRILDLTHCQLDDEAADHIATGLTTNSSLKTLNLSWNKITNTGAVKIFKSLERNITLEELDLSRNDFDGLEDESLKVIVKILTDNQTLRRVDLRNCHPVVTNLQSVSIVVVQ